MQNRFLLVFAIAAFAGLMPNIAGAIIFFSEDFESYTLDGDVTTAGNPGTGTPWTISHTESTVETETDWRLVDTGQTAFAFGLPDQTHFGPATLGGGSTPSYDPTGTVPGGLYMISFSDGLPPALFDSLPDGTTPDDPGLDDSDPYDSRIDNGTYTGASSDMITPSFSTVGATGDVWLHASVSSQLNDNGQAIFDIDVSTDGGTTWINKFRRIAPGSGRDFASGDFDKDLDVDGIDFLAQQRSFNDSDCANCGPDNGPSENDRDFDTFRQQSDQRFSDWEKAYSVYTPLVATTGATLGEGNAGGTHGELDINLGAALGGQADVKIRFRHFESRDDEAILIDNIKVNEVPEAGSEAVTIFSEDFNTMTLGAMDVYTMEYKPFGPIFGTVFGDDSGGGSGTISGFSWGAEDRSSVEFPTGRYNAGAVGAKGVNHLGHPTLEGDGGAFPVGAVPFAIIDPKAEEDNVGDPDNIQSERLHTPLLDLSGQTTVILEWDDEAIIDGDPNLGSVASVVLMEDDDGIAGPSTGDTIIGNPDKLTGIYDPFLPYDQFAGGLFGDDDPSFEHRRLDISSLVAMATDKTKLYVAWQFFSQNTEYWAVDNILITGDGVPPLQALAGTIPEPSSLLLALVGLPVFGATRRRRRCS